MRLVAVHGVFPVIHQSRDRGEAIGGAHDRAERGEAHIVAAEVGEKPVVGCKAAVGVDRLRSWQRPSFQFAPRGPVPDALQYPSQTESCP
jgi:hypothetical protein